jgi:cytochrome c oxidase assembly protein subunit 11
MFGGAWLATGLWDTYCTSQHDIATRIKNLDKDPSLLIPPAERLPPVKERRHLVTVHFQTDCDANMPVLFTPLQDSMEVLVGEPSLAFFSVYNKTDKTIYGLSTYQMIPEQLGYYLVKLQCFCFEEQRIKPHELLELPVLFYLDPEASETRESAVVKHATLLYTFHRVDVG